jgi:phosphate transport system permease protein
MGVRKPREISPGLESTDRWFEGVATAIGLLVLAVTGSVGVFLGLKSIPTFRHYGLHFFTTSHFDLGTNQLGIAAVLLGTVEVALVAMAIAFPLSLMFALFITEYSPRWLKGFLTAAIDLMAAVPSIIYGLWGFYLLRPRAIYVAHWLSQHFAWLPIFRVGGDPNAAVLQQSNYYGSAFIAGIAVSMMAIPLACAVMRAVFDQAPIGEREAAMALGGTRWGVIRKVVLPFGKGGIIGGTMLALGRSLGETAAVLLTINALFRTNLHILAGGTETISALIAQDFSNASQGQVGVLLTAGFVLFVITLIVNSTAATIINRSRSGAGTDI